MVSNVYPEHLQWHGTLERYREDKLRLLNLPGVRRCVLNALAPEVLAAPRATDDVLRFGEPPGWHVAGRRRRHARRARPSAPCPCSGATTR